MEHSAPLEVKATGARSAVGAWRDHSKRTDPLCAMERALCAYRAIDSSLYSPVRGSLHPDGVRTALRTFEGYRESGCEDSISMGFAIAAYVEWQAADAAAESEHAARRERRA